MIDVSGEPHSLADCAPERTVWSPLMKLSGVIDVVPAKAPQWAQPSTPSNVVPAV